MDSFFNVLCIWSLACICRNVIAQPNLAALLGGLNVDRGFVPSWGLDAGMDTSGGGGGGGGSCPYRPHPDRLKFTQEVNQRIVTQNCAPGTMYDHSLCACDNIPKGGSGRGQMSGFNPRQQGPMSGMSSGSNPLNALIAQLQAGSNPGRPRQQTRPAPQLRSRPAPMKPVSRSKSNPMERLRQLMANTPSPLSGGLSINVPKATPKRPIQYQPSPPTNLPPKSTSLLGDFGSNPTSGAFPPELLAMIERAQGPRTGSNGVPDGRKPSSKRNLSPARVSGSGSATVAKSRTGSIHLRAGSKPSSKPSVSNPLADLMAKLSTAEPRGTSNTHQAARPSGSRSDPLAALLGTSSSSSGRRPSPVSRGTGNDLTSLFGGSGSSTSGSNGGLDALLALGNLGSSTPGRAGGTNGGMFSMLNDPQLAQLLGGSSAMSLAAGTLPGQSPPDMTSVFNMQGRMGFGGGIAGLNNINIPKLEQLDRQGLIDLSDLTPAGLAAANAHFSG